jgi:putrescine transport system ATP-binding protein
MELQRRLALTFVIVTHDQSEAMMVADRIGVMDRGRLMQVAPPVEVYERPNSRWVADFVGNVNLWEGRVGADGLSVDGTSAGSLRVAAQIDAAPGATVWLAVRPEKVRIGPKPPPPATNCAEGTVVDIGYLGEMTTYKLRLADGTIVRAAVANTGRFADHPIGWGERVWVSFSPDAAVVLTR